ncbi:hypothetical protein W5O_03365 [Candida albicans Ca6]|nr:hypothetical protein W5O_03365 [Candida albicans Ca6]KHC69137.1 hypothetical protein MGI_03326 [Candida albicans P75016]
MKFSSVVLSALLANLVASAPIKTVIVTAFTTVLVDSKGNTKIQTEAATATATLSGNAAAANTDVTQEYNTPSTTFTATSYNNNNNWASAPSSVQTSIVEPATSEIIEPSTTNNIQTTLSTQTTSSPSTTSATSPSSSSSSSSAQPTGSEFSGEGTFYSTGLGSCGITSTDSDFIVAISHELYDSKSVGNNPNHNPLCNKKIRAFYEGKSVDVTVVDRCEGCAYNDLDFSPAAFDKLADESLGRIDITWEWLN